MASKQVTDPQKSANSVVAAAETHAERIGEALGASTKRDNAAFTDVVRALGSLLVEARDTMVQADKTNEAELADDPLARAARDAAIEALRSELVSLRDALTGIYGAAFSRTILVGERQSTPWSSVDSLWRCAATSVRPPFRGRAFAIDVADIKNRLAKLTTALGQTLKSVSLEGREAQTTLVAKSSAIEEYDAGVPYSGMP